MEFKPVYQEYDFSGDLIPSHPTMSLPHES